MKILLVDDDPGSLASLSPYLEALRHEVVTAADGAAALQAWETDPDIRIVLADWALASLDGVDLCRQIRAGRQERDAYIMLLAGEEESGYRVTGLEGGADEFLVKPVSVAELRARIEIAARILERLEALRRLAHVDPLTELRNRRAFEEELQQCIQRKDRTDPLAIIIVDVNRFKTINDQFGHATGDLALQQIARHLQRCVRSTDNCYRIGGDEFAVLLERTDNAETVIDRIVSAPESLQVEGQNTALSLTLAAGAAVLSPGESATAAEMMQRADQAMYRTKLHATPDVMIASLPGHPRGVAGARPTILVADDDPTVLRLVQAALTGWGYDVLQATTGTQAWQVLDNTTVRFLITDWVMPGIDGLQLCQRIRTLNRSRYTYIILLTVKHERSNIVAGLAAGADDYLTKPFAIEELRVRVRAGERVLKLEDELHRRVHDLEYAVGHVKLLQGLLPICSYCRRIRDDHDYWQEIDAYLSQHADMTFTHSICPDCYEQRLKPQIEQLRRRKEDRLKPAVP